MPAIHVARSIVIDAPVTTVQQSLTDFKQWPAWSPWLYMEPDSQVDYRGQRGEIGHGYDWHGKLIGAGGMTLVLNNPGTIRMDLNFLKPFKSHAKVYFDIAGADADKSTVTWNMDSNLPFFMFFMKRSMMAMIGMDYERGLKMLKEKIETGKIRSSTEVVGIVTAEPCHYVGHTSQSSLADLGESMAKSFPTVMQAAQQQAMEINGPPMSIYNHMDLKGGLCTYTVALPLPVEKTAANPADGLLSGDILPGRALKVTHTGSYIHLGNAWSTAITQQRHQKLKPSKQQPPYERYMNDPGETPEEQLITEIYIPLR